MAYNSLVGQIFNGDQIDTVYLSPLNGDLAAGGYNLSGVLTASGTNLNFTNLSGNLDINGQTLANVKLSNAMDANSQNISSIGTLGATTVNATNLGATALAGDMDINTHAVANMKLSNAMDANSQNISSVGTLGATTINTTNLSGCTLQGAIIGNSEDVTGVAALGAATLNVSTGLAADLSGQSAYSLTNMVDGHFSGTVYYGSLSPAIPSAIFRQANSYYVAKNGNDSNGGSLNAPFLTVQAAITAAEAAYSAGTFINVFVFPGLYTENLSIAKGYLNLIGAGNSDPNSCDVQISGHVSYAVATGNSTAITSSFQGVKFINTSTSDGTFADSTGLSHANSVYFKNCSFLSAHQAIIQQSASDYIYNFDNCVFASSGAYSTAPSPHIQMQGSGFVDMSGCLVSSQLSQVLLELGGSTLTGVRGIYDCSFVNGSSDAAVPQLVWVDTSSYGVPKIFDSCLFSYTDGTTKTGAACAVLVDAAASSNSLVYLYNNEVNILGTAGLGNAFDSTASAASLYYFINNSAVSVTGTLTNYAIVGVLNTSKFSFGVCS